MRVNNNENKSESVAALMDILNSYRRKYPQVMNKTSDICNGVIPNPKDFSDFILTVIESNSDAIKDHIKDIDFVGGFASSLKFEDRFNESKYFMTGPFAWNAYRQYYSFGEEIASSFNEITDNFILRKEVFNMLPYRSFYIEYPDSLKKYFSSKYTKEFGAIVTVISQPEYNRTCFLFTRILKEANGYPGDKFISNSGYYCFTLTGDNDTVNNLIASYPLREDREKYFKLKERTLNELSMYDNDDKIRYYRESIYEIGESLNYNIPKIKKWVRFLIQASMYLCDTRIKSVIESYRSNTTDPVYITEDYIDTWKVDITENSDMTKHKSSNIKKTPHHNDESADDIIIRKRKKQHWRRAHWHHYWYGPGKTQLELLFIAPTLVNNIHDKTPVVVHL